MLAAAVLACTSAVDSVVMDRGAAFSASPHALLSLSLRAPANTCLTEGLAAARASAARGWALAPSRASQDSLHPNLLRVSRGRGPRLCRWQGRNLAVCTRLTNSRVWMRVRARERHQTLDKQHARLTGAMADRRARPELLVHAAPRRDVQDTTGGPRGGREHSPATVHAACTPGGGLRGAKQVSAGRGPDSE
jgi:hypothetical protein